MVIPKDEGKRMRSMTVADLMSSPVLTVTADTNLRDVYDLMDDSRVRHLPVVDEDGALVGLISHRDLVAGAIGGLEDVPMSRVRSYLAARTARSIMMTGVEVAEPDESLSQAAERMLENKFGCLPVVEGTEVVGILTESDFVRFVAEESR